MDLFNGQSLLCKPQISTAVLQTQADRQTDRQTDEQTDGQTGTHRDTHTDREKQAGVVGRRDSHTHIPPPPPHTHTHTHTKRDRETYRQTEAALQKPSKQTNKRKRPALPGALVDNVTKTAN